MLWTHKMGAEVKKMNLRNETITLGELWDNPKAREVLRKRIPGIMKHPVQNRARTVTLGQLSDFLSSWLPEAKIREVIRDLERI